MLTLSSSCLCMFCSILYIASYPISSLPCHWSVIRGSVFYVFLATCNLTCEYGITLKFDPFVPLLLSTIAWCNMKMIG